MKPLDLTNLPFDPAQKANSPSSKVKSEESEEDGESLGKLRHLRALHQSRVFRDQSQKLSKQQSDTPKKMESLTSDKQRM
jgi:hypothetical protein